MGHHEHIVLTSFTRMGAGRAYHLLPQYAVRRILAWHEEAPRPPPRLAPKGNGREQGSKSRHIRRAPGDLALSRKNDI